MRACVRRNFRQRATATVGLLVRHGLRPTSAALAPSPLTLPAAPLVYTTTTFSPPPQPPAPPSATPPLPDPIDDEHCIRRQQLLHGQTLAPPLSFYDSGGRTKSGIRVPSRSCVCVCECCERRDYVCTSLIRFGPAAAPPPVGCSDLERRDRVSMYVGS